MGTPSGTRISAPPRTARTVMTDSAASSCAVPRSSVTPPNATVWVGENIFFLTRRPLPDGMEFQAAMKLDIPMSRAAQLHILPGPEMQRRIKAGVYSTIANCDDDQIKDMGVAQLYADKEEIGDCTVFWHYTGISPARTPK